MSPRGEALRNHAATLLTCGTFQARLKARLGLRIPATITTITTITTIYIVRAAVPFALILPDPPSSLTLPHHRHTVTTTPRPPHRDRHTAIATP